MPQVHPESLASILSELVRSLGFQTNLQVWSLKRNWPRLVGNPLAEHTLPSQLRFRKLTILVDSPAWLHQLTFLQENLLKTLKASLGDNTIAEIRFKVGSLSERDTVRSKAPIPSKPLTEEEIYFIQEALKPISDEKVQASFKRVMERAFKTVVKPVD